jgi:cytochrome bd-type quinol oxidase subunit 2
MIRAARWPKRKFNSFKSLLPRCQSPIWLGCFGMCAADVRIGPFWDQAFAWSSYMATISQGLALGVFINGFVVRDRAHSSPGCVTRIRDFRRGSPFQLAASCVSTSRTSLRTSCLFQSIPDR